jgi:ribosomal protein S18 acetylase RimI-like enzyme
MNTFKLLIDTNVIIGLEDAKKIEASFAELSRKCGENHIEVFVHEASAEDIARDKNLERRAVTLSKIKKFQQLRGIKLPPREILEEDFGAINSPNDEVDVTLLVAVRSKAVDFLITQDTGLYRRGQNAGLGGRVFTVEDALEWIRQTFEPKNGQLPYIDEKFAHEVDRADEIFDSLREGYPDFDKWFDKCISQHRRCWTITIQSELAGIIIRNDESHFDAKTKNLGPKILKLCTFKVKPKFRGEKFGEQLLKQALWHTQINGYDLTYVTAFPNQTALIELLEYYGFEHTQTRSNGEFVLEKVLSRTALLLEAGENPLTAHRRYYPRFSDRNGVKAFCVPIQGDYHRKLFPEIAITTPLPLFPADNFKPVFSTGTDNERRPGNTIRKVYVCRAQTTAIKAGDLLLFYMSKSPSFQGSQSITSIGVVEQISVTNDFTELLRLTAKRSVFSALELEGISKAKDTPVKVIDFLLAGHINPPVELNTLIDEHVFKNSPPQSITLLSPERYSKLKTHIQLGFDL